MLVINLEYGLELDKHYYVYRCEMINLRVCTIITFIGRPFDVHQNIYIYAYIANMNSIMGCEINGWRKLKKDEKTYSRSGRNGIHSTGLVKLYIQ